MATMNTPTGTTTTTNGTKTAAGCCGAQAGAFAAMADCMTETCRAAFDMNKRFVETWTKNVAAMPFSPEQAMARWTNFVTGMTNQAARAMTEMSALMVEQTKVGATMVERCTKTFGTAMTATPKAVPAETRDIVTEAFDATARNTERLTRLGLANFETMTGLVETATGVETATR